MYRSQLLFLAISFLAVFAEAKDKKKDKAKSDKKLKATSFDNNVTAQTWPEPDDKVKDWLLDKDNTNFLDKWQKLEEGVVKKLGATESNFTTEGVCNKRYKCETITYGSIANIDKDVKNPAKALKPISMKNMDKFLDYVKQRKPLKLTHHVQKDSLLAAEIHNSGIVVRITERNGTQIDSEYVAALAFDAYKYIIMKSEPIAVRAVAILPKGKPARDISLCLFPKGANKAQADNFCRGRDADPDEEDEKEAKKGKDKKEDDSDDDSCSADADKAEKKSGSNSLIDLLKSMMGINSDDKKSKSDKKCDAGSKEAKKSKKAKKEKKEKKEKKADGKEAKEEDKGDSEKEEGKGDKEDKEDKKDAPFELESVTIKVAAKKSDKGDSDKQDSATDKADKSGPKDESADKKDEDESDKTDADKPKSDDKAVKSDTEKPKSEKKEKSDAKKAVTKKLEKAVKKAEKAVKKAEKAAKKAANKAVKAVKKEDKPTTTSTKAASATASTTTSAEKKAATKDAAKSDDDTKADDDKSSEDDADSKEDDQQLDSRSAEPEAAYFGGESMDHLYGRSEALQYGQYQPQPQYVRPPVYQGSRQAQMNALRRRQQILRARALARRGLDYEDDETMLRARHIREPRLRRNAMPEPEPEPIPEPEPEAGAEPEAEPEAEAEAEPEAEAEAGHAPAKRGYLLSLEFFDDLEHLLKRQSAGFNDDAQELLERGLGLDEGSEYYEW